MIIATMFGGPRDGLEVAVQELTPLVFPVVTGVVLGANLPDNDPEPTMMMTVTYVPQRDSLTPCPHCQPPARHFTCRYYVAGWGR